MKEKTKFALLILVIMCLWIVLLPIIIIAEEVTTPYYTTSPILVSLGTGGYAGDKLYVNASDFRVVFSDQNTQYQFAVVSPDLNAKVSFQSYTSSYDPSPNWSNISPIERTIVKDGVTYRIGYWTSSKSHQNMQIEYATNQSFRNNDDLIFELTYGYVEPEPPINWGILNDVEFQTRIAGQGLASKRNIDYLSWQNVTDANGNDISECDVEVQAVLGRFYANTEADLLEKTLNDFDIGTYNAVNLGTVPASQGTYSASWQRIIDLAGWNFDSIYAHLEDNIYLKTGWYYQIRLIAPDGYVGSWQTLYTPLAQSATASETVINDNSYSMNIYQVYEQLTQLNNQTSITVTFDNTTYTIQNPNDGTEPAEPLDYFDILKQLLNGIIQIIGNIQALPQRLGEKVQELITPQLSEGESLSDQFHQRYEEYMSSEQTTIYDFLQGVEDLQPYISDLAPGDEGVHTCIIRWDNVTMDLSMFNAGTVTFIQGGEYNLTLAFLNLLHAFNMDYEDYEFYTSAIIYLWLCVFVWRHFKHFLEKE